MTQTIFAKKLHMTEAYLGDNRVAVTQLSLYTPEIVREKTVEKDGYNSQLVTFGKTLKSKAKKYLCEVQELLDVVEVGSIVDITGTTKGKGLAGVVKKWGFAGGPRTHGQSDRLRRSGSIGQGTTPGRVYKNKHMSGRMGQDTKTVKNLTVVAVDNTLKSIWVSGPVPGTRNGLIKITLKGKVQNLGELKFLKGYDINSSNTISDTQA